jgi:hypothetical protein
MPSVALRLADMDNQNFWSKKKLKQLTNILRRAEERNYNAMAAVYKSLSKTNGSKAEAPANGVKKNKQRVLILSSRGITYRQASLIHQLIEISVLTFMAQASASS